MRLSTQPLSENLETLADGLTRHTLYDQQIVVYTLENVNRKTIDAWITAMHKRIQTAPPDHRFYTMYDLSHGAIGFTPYIRRRFQEFAHDPATQHATGRTALLIQKTVLTQLVRLFVEREVQKRYKNQEIKIFFDGEAALAWLYEDVRKQS